MLIIGAKGFAKEVLEVLHQSDDIAHLVFYDDVNIDVPNFLYGQFKVLKTLNLVQDYFANKDNRFTIGIGNPILRKKLCTKFELLGGALTSTISPKAHIGIYGNIIGLGCNLMTNSVLTNDIIIGKGVLINLSCTIGHDCIIGDFVELCPDVNISGNCTIGDFSFIGTNVTILPNIKIGKNVIIGAGSVVTKNVPDNSLVIGTPAIVKKVLPELDFL